LSTVSTAFANANKQPAPPPTNGPDDDAIAAVNLSRMKEAQERFASENGSLRSVFAKAEIQGIHLKAAKRAIAIVKAGDADSWLKETSAITRYLRIMRHGITENQLSLDLESTLAPIEEKAALDGRSAGLAGDPESANPHAINTKAGQSWIAAFRQGLSERELVLSMKDDDAAEED
jgi:hypothetical protein